MTPRWLFFSAQNMDPSSNILNRDEVFFNTSEDVRVYHKRTQRISLKRKREDPLRSTDDRVLCVIGGRAEDFPQPIQMGDTENTNESPKEFPKENTKNIPKEIPKENSYLLNAHPKRLRTSNSRRDLKIWDALPQAMTDKIRYRYQHQRLVYEIGKHFGFLTEGRD